MLIQAAPGRQSCFFSSCEKECVSVVMLRRLVWSTDLFNSTCSGSRASWFLLQYTVKIVAKYNLRDSENCFIAVFLISKWGIDLFNTFVLVYELIYRQLDNIEPHFKMPLLSFIFVLKKTMYLVLCLILSASLLSRFKKPFIWEVWAPSLARWSQRAEPLLTWGCGH